MIALKRGSSSLLRWQAQEWPGASSMNSETARAQCSRALDWRKPIGARSIVRVQAGLCALTFSFALTTVPPRRSPFSKSNHSIVVVIAETPLCAGTHNRSARHRSRRKEDNTHCQDLDLVVQPPSNNNWRGTG